MTPPDHTDPWDRGLAADLDVMLERRFNRRAAFGLFAGVGAVALLAACGNDSDSGTAATDPTTGDSTAATTATTDVTDSTAASECASPIPQETGGPFPGDGSNGPNALADPAIVRRDITTSFGEYTGTATGVPTTVTLTVLDSDGCTPLAGSAVYLWHADADGLYSMYTAPDANYLRGVQEADAAGSLSFDTVMPGCYDGRWPHMHFEIYASVDDALGGGSPVRTSQLAVPEATCQEAYATDGYETSVDNLTRITLDSDMVFSDGWDNQLAAVSGDVDSGFVLTLPVVI